MPPRVMGPTHDRARPVTHLYPKVRAGVSGDSDYVECHAVTPSRHDDSDERKFTRERHP